jgi:23S rRNA-/tRNA-specific pseudouridylate synthase
MQVVDTWSQLREHAAAEVLVVSMQEAGTRIDKFLSDKFPEHTRSFLGDLCAEGKVRVNGYVLHGPCTHFSRLLLLTTHHHVRT